eukprot:CAMPEP_0181307184 /NCGR_PEP_ID=MMETSP1101-20121128/10732_1 /TAXON_ID=46948 /ORGANISM="Rhodomonas abbreviata, Strain Caron Lab Isolate" /LENGTH=439 /DNA_ID=CAMNT_0023413359 /DNA_START=114 /DNA_END=1433 /DNA_ORIENTATION=+
MAAPAEDAREIDAAVVDAVTADMSAVAVGGEEQGDAADESDGGSEDCLSDAEEELVRESTYRHKMMKSRQVNGPNHDKTLQKTLRLVSCLIGQYKLNETDELLDIIMPACKEKGGKLYLKAIQSRAFCLFKQYRFKDALTIFHEQATLVGPSAALYENMAHTYNSIGDYDNAAKYFTEAMSLLGQGSYGKKGGILLGLGLVKERQGNPREALPVLQQALQHYKDDCKTEDGSSLIAKAHMSVGQCHEMLGELPEGAEHIRDAASIFQKTVGKVSPLYANAIGVLGRILIAQGKRDEAEPLIHESLDTEANKDAFHPDTIWKLLNTLKELWTENRKPTKLEELHANCRRYVGTIETIWRRIDELKLETDPKSEKGTIAVIFKTAAELLMLAGEYGRSRPYLQRALKLLEAIKDFDCSVLIQSCVSSLRFVTDAAAAASAD